MKIAPLLAVLALAATAHAQTTITIDRNAGPDATAQFRFQHVPSPARDDAAAKATLTLLGGALDTNGPDLAALTDGAVPTAEDQPETNVFFRPNSWGGRVRFDLGAPIDVAQINSYSWHPGDRGPQVYKVFGALGTEPALDPAPSTKLDPAAAGWKLIAFVDTRTQEKGHGGQYGVSIANPSGLGRFRYMLFDFFESESDDSWGQTFWSEVDVVRSPR